MPKLDQVKQFERDDRWHALDDAGRKSVLTGLFNEKVATPTFHALPPESKVKVLDVFLAEQLKRDSPGFTGSFARGVDEMQAMGGGALAILGDITGLDKVQDVGMDIYARNMEEAEKNAGTVRFKDIDVTSEGGLGRAGTWAVETMGALGPSMIEAATGAMLGTAVAPGPGTATGAFFAKTILKRTIDHMVKEGLKHKASKSLVKKIGKEAAEKQLRLQAERAALRTLGGQAGMVGAVSAVEAGGNYGELFEEYGVSAPGTSLALGLAAGSVELLGGNIGLVKKVLGEASGDALAAAFRSGKGHMVRRVATDLVKNMPAESMQEGTQELLSILNVVANTDEKLMTGKNWERIQESMAAGALAGGAGAVVSGAMPGRAEEGPPPGPAPDQAQTTPVDETIISKLPVDGAFAKLEDEPEPPAPWKVKEQEPAPAVDYISDEEAESFERDVRLEQYEPKAPPGLTPEQREALQREYAIEQAAEDRRTAEAEYRQRLTDVLASEEYNLPAKLRQTFEDHLSHMDTVDEDEKILKHKPFESVLKGRKGSPKSSKERQEEVAWLLHNAEKNLPDYGKARIVTEEQPSLPVVEEAIKATPSQPGQIGDIVPGEAEAPAATKEPWQMTLAEYEDFAKAGGKDGVHSASTGPYTAQKKADVRREHIRAVQDAVFGGENVEPQGYWLPTKENITPLLQRLRSGKQVKSDEKGYAFLNRSGLTMHPRPKANFIEKLTPAGEEYLDSHVEKKAEPVEAAIPKSPDGDYQIYKTQVRQKDDSTKEMYAVPTRERKTGQGFGDELYNTIDEAIAATELNRRKDADDEKIETARIEEEQKAAETKAAEEDLDGFDSDMSPMSRGKAIAALKKPIRYQGEIYTRRDLIRKLVNEDGYVVAANDRLVAPDGSFFEKSVFTKTGIDYARHLSTTVPPTDQAPVSEVVPPPEDAGAGGLPAEAISRNDVFEAAKDRFGEDQKYVSINDMDASTEAFGTMAEILDDIGKKIESRKAEIPELSIRDFSEKSIAVSGKTKENIDRIKGVKFPNGKNIRPLWNRKTTSWLFPKKHEALVREQLADLLGVTPAAEPAAEQKEILFEKGEFVSFYELGTKLIGEVTTTYYTDNKNRISVKATNTGKFHFVDSDELSRHEPPTPPKEPEEAAEPTDGRTVVRLSNTFRKYFNGIVPPFKTITQARNIAMDALRVSREEAETGKFKKTVDEAIEYAIVKEARRIIAKGREEGRDRKYIFDKLVALYEIQPRLGTKTSESNRMQAYSTPAPAAFVASELAGITEFKTVYEPTAGTGMLLIGTNPTLALVNELGKERNAILKDQAFNVRNYDAAEKKPMGNYDVVIANPPFGKLYVGGVPKTWEVGDFTTGEIDQAIAFKALEAMKEGGRAVLILGGISKQSKTQEERTAKYNAGNKKRFYKKLYDDYNIVDHFTIAGELYAKQGAGWPIDVIVIDGKGQSKKATPGFAAPPVYRSFEEIGGRLNEAKPIYGLDTTREQQDAEDVGPYQGTEAATSPYSRPVRPGAGQQVDRPDTEVGGPAAVGVGPAIDTGAAQPDATGAGVTGEPGAAGTGIEPVTAVGDGQLGAAGVVAGTGSVTEEQPGITDQTEPGGREPIRAPEVGGLDVGAVEGGAGELSLDNLGDLTDADLQALMSDVADEMEGTATTPPHPPQLDDTAPTITPTVHKVPKANFRKDYDRTPAEFVEWWEARSVRNRPKKKRTRRPAPPKTPKDHLKDVKKNIVNAMGDALNGLDALFGDANTLSMGMTFNEETYQKAKPHFQKSWDNAKAAGYSLSQFIKSIFERYGTRVQAYLTKFIQEQRAADQARKKTVAKPPVASEGQTTYTPASENSAIGSLVPTNMSGAIQKALAGIVEKHGSVDGYVAKSLKWPINKVGDYLAAEQIDAVALILNNFENGNGFVLGDQTGIGKGRVVAATIRYSLLNGHTPVFLTEKDSLYKDMYRDLVDIGMPEDIHKQILMTNQKAIALDDDGDVVLKSPTGWARQLAEMRGDLPKGKKIVFTTYDQFSDGKKQGTVDPAPRRRFMRDLVANGNVNLVMDEAHTAGGSGDLYNLRPDRQTGVTPDPRALFIRRIIPQANAVLYSSATYAKTPDVMDLYSATDLSLGVGGNIRRLAAAVKSGGVPFQQITANMLAEAGQYTRSERSFDGVTYKPEMYEVDTAAAENISASLQEMRMFEDEVTGPIFDTMGGQASGAVGGGAEKGQNFTSLMHNIIGQMVLALKTPHAVQQAIDTVNKGNNEQVVLTLSNTMGAFIQDYAAANGINEGDRIDIGFNDLLYRYLWNTRKYLVDRGDGNGKKDAFWLTDEELGPEGLAEYNRIAEFIEQLNLDALPVSPVDYMHNELRKAGIISTEITGRQQVIDYSGAHPVLRKRPAKERSTNGKNKTIRKFNAGDSRVIILNRSGSTGISLHASEKNPAQGQGKRTMILIQPEADINQHMQMLGRVHRTGQVVTPDYVQAVANIPAEKKLAAMLLSKMKSLNANTTADADSLFTDKETVDFVNKYGDQIATEMLRGNSDINMALGRPVDPDGTGVHHGAIKKLTGRLPLLPIAQQERIYNALVEEYNFKIEELDAAGRNDLVAKTYETDAETTGTEIIQDKSGESPFEGEVVSETVNMKRLTRPYTSDQVRELVDGNMGKESAMADALKAFDESFYPAKMDEADQRIEEAETASVLSGAEERKRQMRERLNNARLAFRQWMNRIEVGKTVHFTFDPGESSLSTYGVIADVETRGTTRNPIALSNWIVAVPVHDGGSAVIRQPLSKYESGSYAMSPQQLMNSGRDIIDGFDTAAATTMEERTIITGNLFSGFTLMLGRNGRIVHFTRDNGEITQGILMPAGFDADLALSEIPVAFTTSDQAADFLKQAAPIQIHLDQPGGFRINYDGRQFIARTDSARTRHRRYTEDDAELLGIVGGSGFHLRGRSMVTDPLSEQQVKGIIDLFLSRGAIWEARESLQTARNVTGAETSGEWRTYRIQTGEGEAFTVTGKPVDVPGITGHELFTYYDDITEEWNVSELTTGLKLSEHGDSKEAIELAGRRVAELGGQSWFDGVIESAPKVDQDVPAPRYSIGKARKIVPAKKAELEKDIRSWLSDVLPDSVVENIVTSLEEEIDTTTTAQSSIEQHAELGTEGGRTLGATTIYSNPLVAAIEIAHQAPGSAQETTYHEAFHVAAEWLLPKKTYENLLKHFGGNSEAVANAFAEWSMGKKTELPAGRGLSIRRAFNRLKQILEAIKNGFAGKGFTTPEAVFENIWGKKYAPHFAGAPGVTTQLAKERPTIAETFDVPEDHTLRSSIKNMFTSETMTAESAKKEISKARTKLIDRLHPIEQLGELPYRLHRLLNNSHAVLSTFLQHGNLKWRDEALTIYTKDEGFLPWLHALGEDGRDLFYWMATKRAERLEEEGRENWLTPEVRDSINDELFAGLNGEERRAKEKNFEKLNQRFQQWNRNIINIAVDAGLISKEQTDSWMRDFYLPFYRILEDEATHDEFLQGPRKSKKHISAQIKRLKGGEEKLGDPLENILRNWAHLIDESQRNVARANAAEVALDMGMAEVVAPQESFKSPGARRENYVISYQENGKTVYMKVPDPDLFEALASVNTKVFDSSLMKLMSGAKRLLTAGATFTPAFRIANALRDTIHTAVVSKNFLPFIDTAKGFAKVWQESPEFVALMASGGGFGKGWIESGDPKAMARSVEKILKREGKGVRGNIIDTPRRMLEFWERIGMASEMAARVQLYTNLKMEGEPHMEAAYKARDLLDFFNSGAGNAVRVIMATTPFLNARIQGLDRMYRGAKEDPKAFFVKGALVAGASLLLWSLAADDERYKELEDWEKWQYHHFWIGETHFRIPKAFEVGAIFSSLFESMANVAAGNEDMEFFKRFLAHTLTQTFALNMPALFGPSVEAYANRSTFTGRPIESLGKTRLPPGERADPWTPEILKDLGREFGISPLKAQHLIRNHTAAFGAMFLTVADAMYRGVTDAAPRPALRIEDVPGVGRFVRSADSRTKYANRYYEFAKEVDNLAATISNYKSIGNYEMARKITMENRDSLLYKKFINKTRREISKIRKQEKRIWSSKLLTPEQKRRQLRELFRRKNRIYQIAYRTVSR